MSRNHLNGKCDEKRIENIKRESVKIFRACAQVYGVKKQIRTFILSIHYFDVLIYCCIVLMEAIG
jgi:hypothetical protein